MVWTVYVLLCGDWVVDCIFEDKEEAEAYMKTMEKRVNDIKVVGRRFWRKGDFWKFGEY